MIISDTSALVLNWTSKDIWKSESARAYFMGLDLSAADPLFKKFGDEENFIQTHLMSNRKFFVRKCAVEFAQKCEAENETPQIVILAAGIDPLSVEIASLYPNSVVFDVDKYQMIEKQKHLGDELPNIKFIECDITNTQLLKQKLISKGWIYTVPCMLIMEGIMYYLVEDNIKKVLSSFSPYVSTFVCDIGLTPELVSEKYREHGMETRKKIMETVGLDFMNCYEPDHFLQLLIKSGFSSVQMVTLGEIQQQRTGQRIPFDGDGSSAWVVMITAENLHE